MGTSKWAAPCLHTNFGDAKETLFCPSCGWEVADHAPDRRVTSHDRSVPDQLRRAPIVARLAYMAAESLALLNQYGIKWQANMMDGGDEVHNEVNLNRELEGYLGGPTLTELINGLNECAQVWDRG